METSREFAPLPPRGQGASSLALGGAKLACVSKRLFQCSPILVYLQKPVFAKYL